MKHKKPTKTQLKNKADKLFSELIRHWGVCQWCHRKKDRLECAHIVSRGVIKLRYDFHNALCLCTACHFKAHHHPLEFAELVKDVKGDGIYKDLMNKSKQLKPIDLKWYQKTVDKLTELHDAVCDN